MRLKQGLWSITVLGALERVDICNAPSDLWTTTGLDVPRYGLSADVNGDHVVFAGGSGYSDKVYLFNLDTHLWSISQLSQARSKLVAISFSEGCVILFAGRENGAGVSDVMDILDTSSIWWTSASLSVGRKSLAEARTNKKFIFAGGETDGTDGANTEAIDIVNVTVCTSSTSGDASSGLISSNSTGEGSSQSQSSTGSTSTGISTPSGSIPSDGGCMSSSAVKGTKMESKLWKIRKI